MSPFAAPGAAPLGESESPPEPGAPDRRDQQGESARPEEPGRPGQPGGRYRRATIIAVACYLLGALVLTWRLWADPASRAVANNWTDADLFAWYLRYAADAVQHGSLPALVTAAINAPQGVNMMWNTSVLLPGVLLAPVTMLFGPQVSLTILTTAGFAGSATTMFVVLRRWQVSAGAAGLAGAVYGFSPAMLHSAVGHYNLQLGILPPLIIDAGLRIATGIRPATRARWLARVPTAVRDGVLLGILIAAQVFISEEMALLTALTGALLVAGLAAARPAAAARRIGRAAAGLAVAGAVAFALAGHALRVQFAGPLPQHGPLFPPDYYVNDLTGFVNPSGYLLFHTAGTAATAASYQGGLTEYLAYLGWPLIIALALAAGLTWRKPAGRTLALTLAFLVVFSLGGHPLVGGHTDPTVFLPWHWLEEHRLLSSVLPDRISLLADGIAAALLAVGVDAVRDRLAAAAPGHLSAPGPIAGTPGLGPAARPIASTSGHRPAPELIAEAPGQRPVLALASVRPRQRHAIVLAAAAAACLPLLPLPVHAATLTPLPAGWSATFAALRLPAGARVLVVPVPSNILTVSMRWQADTGQRIGLVGGYFIGPGAIGGQEYLGGPGIRPTASYLDRLWAAGLPPGGTLAGVAAAAGLPTASPAGPVSAGTPPTLAQLRADFGFWRPAAVVAVTAAGSPLGRYLTGLLGQPTVREGSVLAWRRAPSPG